MLEDPHAPVERHLPEPYRVYAFLHHLERDHSDRFHYSSDEQIREHSTKLNLLADMIAFSAASDDDPLLFIDGDAFPIADLGPEYIVPSVFNRQVAPAVADAVAAAAIASGMARREKAPRHGELRFGFDRGASMMA